jgi:biotin operon repressor
MSLTLREKVLRTFQNPVYNTFTLAQATARFGVSAASISKAVKDLRLAGYPIYRNKKTHEGRTINVYRLGTPSKRYRRNMKAGRTQIALDALNG